MAFCVPSETKPGAPKNKNDWLTIAAVAVMDMCLVTFDREALGHGGACLLRTWNQLAPLLTGLDFRLLQY